MSLDKFVVLILTSIFINNIVFSKIIGLFAFFQECKKMKTAFSIGVSTVIIITISSTMAWFIKRFFVYPFNIKSIETLIYLIIIIFVGYLINVIAHKLKIASYSPLSDFGIIANSSVLGALLINLQNDLNLIETVISAFFLGIGYLLALLITSGINERLEETKAPEAFRGIPILLISMGIVAMVFMGFFGIKG